MMYLFGWYEIANYDIKIMGNVTVVDSVNILKMHFADALLLLQFLLQQNRNIIYHNDFINLLLLMLLLLLLLLSYTRASIGHLMDYII
jgi:hypothetical protein